MNRPTLMLLLGSALTAAAVPGSAGSGSYQLLCIQPAGGLVRSVSESHVLTGTIDWPVAGGIHRSENYRLISGCNGARFERDFFNLLFRDRFRQNPP
jgi:hypothetical protein